MERFECYVIASKNHGQPEEKCSFFLSCCGPAMFVSARALAAPRPAYKLGWDNLMAKLKSHYAPTPSKIARRFAFRRRIQKLYESISQFLESLRTTAAQCDFQNLEENLVEQFVCGVRDVNLRSRMFRHQDITLLQAVETARAAELSEQSTADIERLQLASPTPAQMSAGLLLRPTAQPQAQPRRQPPRPARRAEDCHTIYQPHAVEGSVSQASAGAWKVAATVQLEGQPCLMEVDSGSSRSLLSWAAFSRLCPKVSQAQLLPADTTLWDYQGNLIPTLGSFPISVAYGSFQGKLPILVVKKSLPALLGLDWFPALGLSIGGVHRVVSSSLEGILSEFADVFDGQLGCYKGTPISLSLDPQVAPIWLKARRVPFALRAKVDAELDKLLAQGVIEPVDHSRWETPIVLPVKPDRSVQICADYKSTINLALQANPYPVPVVQHLLHSLGQGCIFAKLDMAQAYQQLPVDDDAAAAQTIVTHRGAFRCRRLQFGVSVAPGIFQSLMERLLHGLPGVVPYFDDVLIAATSRSELIEILRNVLCRFRGAGLKLKSSKCSFAVPRVEFLETLTSSAVLIQYNDRMPLTLACDASPYGLGAVLSHVLPNGSEAPVAFYSRTLSLAECNYSQIDKEALAAVSGIKRFHDYLYGRHLTLVTDHKPLLGLLAGDKPTPPILSPRMTRWTEFLAAYSYTLQYRPGKQLGHADARGWPTDKVADSFRPFKAQQAELSLHGGCLIWGDRVVIPATLRPQVLPLLHKDHPGIVHMKALAHSYVWWPLLDAEIAAYVGRCTTCQLSRPNPPAGPAREWEAPRGPWSRLHVDFAGPFHGQNFLIVVDAYSRWVELVLMASTTAESTVRALRRLFATHGLPDILVSDNGLQFTATAFQEFLAEQGIRHAPTAPYHLASNGRAERAVRSAKEALGRMDRGDWQSRVAAYLLSQHPTPCPTTNKSPAELLMGRRLRTPLDRVGLANGSEWRRHLDQLRRRLPMEPTSAGPDNSATPQPESHSQAFTYPGLTYQALPDSDNSIEIPQSDQFRQEAFSKSGLAYPSAPCRVAPQTS
ncbi:PREDICTED: LOW QUALITY PROTEIN: uncharacterized protein LOC106542012 [Thamnophis sirtalis]|uniref:Gypsy retrotransposon integrase-like protein 1 n=1 Tax=Thamnophis sirtalis TaxID=35019 RepID=A0A6I9Y5F0_9SAUR|nr:PREDICTED: LOW QUALITY PROTEIN: uncharacterized protein LOC106542012 [Thamnophis sirtalis]